MAQSLASKIKWLFQHVTKPGGHAYSCQEIAARIEACCPGFTVSPSQIWNLRHGISDNPSWRLMIGLSKAFDVSPLYFVEDSAATHSTDDMYALITLKARGVLHLASCLATLSPTNKQIATNLIEHLATLEPPALIEAS